jgi:cyclic lactone autoinducer peptide
MFWRLIAAIIEWTVTNSVSTTCYGWSYQPKVPSAISKFKK